MKFPPLFKEIITTPSFFVKHYFAVFVQRVYNSLYFALTESIIIKNTALRKCINFY